jgi:hypothetical protein
MALHGAIVSAQGSRTVPAVPNSSPAGQDLMKSHELSTTSRPKVVESTCASIERLSFASADLLRGLASNCREPTIAIVSVARMLMECSARLAHLADPSISTVDRVCRVLNETVEELNQWDKHVRKFDLLGMSEQDRQADEADQLAKRHRNESWAETHGVSMVGGRFLKQPRVTAQSAIRLCLQGQAARLGSDSAMASNVGLLWYHNASTASHLLPDGLNSFVATLDPSTCEPGFGISHMPIVAAVEAAVHCLLAGHETEAIYWGWPRSTDVARAAAATFDCLHGMPGC